MTKFDEIKVKLHLSIGFPVANLEDVVFLHEYISEENWNKLDLSAKQEFLEEEILNEWANDYIEKSVYIDELGVMVEVVSD